MISKPYSFRLDIKAGAKVPNIEFVVGDTLTNILNIELTDGQNPIDVTDTSITITFLKPDGHIVIRNVEIVDASAGKIRYTLGTQETAVPGTVRATVEIYAEGGTRLTTGEFSFIVRDELGNVDIESTTEFGVLTELIGENLAIQAAEAMRVENENERKTNESARQTNEANRVSAEINRANAENTRITNEDARKAAEAIRAMNEAARQAGYNSMIVIPKSPVNTFAEITTTYHNPEHGWVTRVINDGDKTGNLYRYDSNSKAWGFYDKIPTTVYDAILAEIQQAKYSTPVETTASVISIPESCEKGQLRLSAFGNSRRNIATIHTKTVTDSTSVVEVVQLEAGVQYTLSSYIDNSLSSDRYARIRIKDSTPTYYIGNNIEAGQKGYSSITFVATQTGAYTIETQIGSGTNVSNKYFSEILLEKSSTRFHWISGTKSTVSSFRLKGTNENRFDGRFPYVGGLTSAGVADGVAGKIVTSYIRVKPNTTYIFKNFDGITISRACGYSEKNEASFIQLISNSSSISELSFTTGANVNFIRISFSTTDKNTRLAVYEGSIATSYIAPVTNNESYISTPDGQPLRSVGSVKDEINEKGEKIKRIGEGVLGSELVTGGDFSNPANWSVSGWSISNGVASYLDISIGHLQQNINLTSGKLYEVTFSISNTTNASIILATTTGGQIGHVGSIGQVYQTLTNGTYTFYMKAVTTVSTFRIYGNTTGSTFDLDNFSIKEIDTSNGEVVSVPDSTNIFPVSLVARNYQLMQEQVTKLDGIETLTVYPGGQIIVEPIRRREKIYSATGISVDAAYPIKSIESVWKVVGNTYTPVDLSKVTVAADKLSFTITGAVVGEEYRYIYEYPSDLTTLPTIRYSYPLNIAASLNDVIDIQARLSKELGDVWMTLLALADRELKMYMITGISTPATATTTDVANKINEIINVWK